MSAVPAPTAASRWRAGPRRLGELLLGLWLFGTGEGLVVGSELGNSPWTVFAEGLAVQTPLSVGAATIAISGGVLLAWIPLRQAPGLGTLANAVVVGVAIDVTLLILPHDAPVPVRVAELLGGIGLVAVGSGIYLLTRLGPGPRDGLMVGLHRRTGRPVGLVRTAIELTALLVGALLGGTFGVGTVAFAVLIGPAVGWVLRRRGAEAGGL